MNSKMLAILMAGALVTCTACGASSGSTSGTSNAAPASSSNPASGGTPANGAETSLVMSWWGNQARNERTQKAIDAYMEATPGVTIEGQFADWTGYWDKLATMASGGSLPDVFQQHSSYLVQYEDADLMLDLTPYIESGALDVSKISESVLELGKVNGKVRAICSGVGAWGLTYNATLLQENAIEIKDNMSVEDFINISRAVYEKTGVKTCLSATPSDAAAIMEYVLRAEGFNVWQDGALGAQSYEQLKPYFQILETGVKEGWLINPGVLVERTGNEQQPIVYGETPAERSWCIPAASNVYLSYVAAAPEGTQLKLTTLPSNDTKKSNAVMASQFFSVSNQTKNPDEAVAFMNWLINSEESNKIQLAERGVPANSDIVSVISPLVNEPTAASLSFVNDLISKNCSDAPPSIGAKVAEAKAAFGQTYEKVCYGEMDAEQAAKTFFEEANKILKG